MATKKAIVNYSGKMKELAAGDILSNGNTLLTLANDFVVTSSTHADVTGMEFSCLAGKSYIVKFIGQMTSAVATTGSSHRWRLVSGTIKHITNTVLQISTNNSTASSTNSSAYDNTGITGDTSFGAVIGSGAGSTATGYSNITVDVVINCTSNAVIRLQWASEVNGQTHTLNAGSIISIQQLS